MQSSDPLLRATASTFVLLLGVAAACSSSDKPSASGPGPLPSFGGAAPVVDPELTDAGATAGKDGEGDASLPSVCGNVPKGSVALLDDFEDGDANAAPENHRQAFWFVVHDDSPGTVVPDTQFVPEPGGANGSSKAAHVQTSDFSIWGANLSVDVSYVAPDLHCPYNASAFSGVRFFGRGNGRVRVSLSVPETQDKEYGGACDPNKGMVCYDTHGVYVLLDANWKLIELPWSVFVQRNFGTPATLRPEAIMAVQFNFETADLPSDFWADDVGFWDGKVTPPGGTGGTGGSGGGSAGAAGAPTETGGDAGMGGA